MLLNVSFIPGFCALLAVAPISHWVPMRRSLPSGKTRWPPASSPSQRTPMPIVETTLQVQFDLSSNFQFTLQCRGKAQDLFFNYHKRALLEFKPLSPKIPLLSVGKWNEEWKVFGLSPSAHTRWKVFWLEGKAQNTFRALQRYP